jgi:hypothetical protein
MKFIFIALFMVSCGSIQRQPDGFDPDWVYWPPECKPDEMTDYCLDKWEQNLLRDKY